MALESVTTIADLNASNPTSSDPKSQGDDHIRNIKTALLAWLASARVTGVMGFATGAGGTLPSGSGTLNKACGTVTFSSISNGATGTALVTNSLVGAADTVVCSLQNNLANYDVTVMVSNVSSGAFRISVVNNTGSPFAPVVNFAVIKGVTS